MAGYTPDSLDKHRGHSIAARLTQAEGFIARVVIVNGVCKDWTAANVPDWKSMHQQILVVTDQFRGQSTFSLDGVLGTLLGYIIDDVCRTEAYLDAIRLLDVQVQPSQPRTLMISELPNELQAEYQRKKLVALLSQWLHRPAMSTPVLKLLELC